MTVRKGSAVSLEVPPDTLGLSADLASVVREAGDVRRVKRLLRDCSTSHLVLQRVIPNEPPYRALFRLRAQEPASIVLLDEVAYLRKEG